MPITSLPKNIRIFTAKYGQGVGHGAISETQYDLSRFPAGEICARITDAGSETKTPLPPLVDKLLRDQGGELFWADIRSSDDLMALVMLRDAHRRAAGEYGRSILVMPYVPYGRQDRVTADGEAFSLKVFAALINSMGFSGVISFDPHSLVTNALIDKFIPVELADLLPDKFPSVGWIPTCVVAPDAGATRRAEMVARKMGVQVVQAMKRRFGNRVETWVYSYGLSDAPCLVVDDICDGGATFLALADVLKTKNAASLTLLVTHGIFSAGLDALAEKYEKIYTVNNISGLTHPKLEVI